MTIFFFLALLLADIPSPPTDAATVRAVALADLDPGRFVFVPGSRADDVAGYWQVEAEGPPGCLRMVAFTPPRMTTASTSPRPSSSRASWWSSGTRRGDSSRRWLKCR